MLPPPLRYSGVYAEGLAIMKIRIEIPHRMVYNNKMEYWPGLSGGGKREDLWVRSLQ
jgi:hypothetical protein